MSVRREVVICRSARDEAQQRLVDLVGVGPQQSVRGAVDLDVVGVRDQVPESSAGDVDGQDPVGAAVQDQRRQTGGADGLGVGAEVLDPARDDGVRRDGSADGGGVPARADDVLADPRPEGLVEVVEVPGRTR
jgi:hypothetical protein